MASFLENKVKKPIMDLLQSGVSAEKLALSLAFGVTCGVFPLPGLTTVPVIITTFIFRLNPVAPLLVNYVCTPLNIASFPVFLHYGNEYLSADGSSFSMSSIVEGLKTNPLETVMDFRFILLNGILAWMIFLPFATILVYFILLPFLRSATKHLEKKQ